AIELRCGAKSRRTGADDGDFSAGPGFGRFGSDPTFFPALIDDGTLDVLDRHRRGVDAEDTRAFAGGGADPAGKLGEVVGLVQSVERFAPEAAINQIVPLRDQVVDRAARRHAADQCARVTERNAAIHATRALLAELWVLQVIMKLVP